MPKYDKRVSIFEKIIRYCEQINQIAERFGKTYEAFHDDFAYQNACAMCIFQIGELGSRLPEDFRAKYDQIPWKLIRAMRNMFAHEYEKVNIEEVWGTIETDIPILKARCEEILHSLRGESEP